jgi:ribosomal protein S18 acetylase RimI-like enzyme
MAFDIQPMQPGARDMCEMITRANWPGDKRVTESIHDELQNPDIHYCVALARGRVVGFAGWAKSHIDYDVAEFVWCNVLADFRGRGIGRLLTDFRLADIRAAGFKSVVCGTMVPNIYMAYGFKSLGTFDWAHGKTNLMILTL